MSIDSVFEMFNKTELENFFCEENHWYCPPPLKKERVQVAVYIFLCVSGSGPLRIQIDYLSNFISNWNPFSVGV